MSSAYVSCQLAGTWEVGRKTAGDGVAFAALIAPFTGLRDGSSRLLFGRDLAGMPNWWDPQPTLTHITTLIYTTGATLHQLAILRPKNFTYFSAAVPINTKAISLNVDPGVYSTNYNYPLAAGQAPALVADHAIQAGDYVAYQFDDGVWALDTIASGTFGGGNLTLTTGTPNRAGATIRANSPLFYMGLVSLNDPATGYLDPQFDTTAATTNEKWQELLGPGLISTLHPGDPMIFYSPNTVNAGKLGLISGYYGAI
jgi:hypothetical protein